MRTIVIGDVHGCNRTLHALLEKVKPEAETDRLVFLGDLFDRGPDSYGVFLTVRNLLKQFGGSLILLYGNHEDYLLQDHLTRQQRAVWEAVGRQATVRSFRQAGSTMEEAASWLRGHVRVFWRTEEFQCVHAGIKIDPPEMNDLYTLVHDHNTVYDNRYSGKLTVTGHVALEKATWFPGNGETAEQLADEEIRDLPDRGVICIDTGCGKGGRLTAMTVEGNRFILYSMPEG